MLSLEKKVNTNSILNVCMTHVVLEFFPSKWLQFVYGGLENIFLSM